MNKIGESINPPTGIETGIQSGFLSALVTWLMDLFTRAIHRLDRTLPTDGSEAMTGPLELMEYTDTPDTKPAAASYEGTIIYVSDGGAGAKFRGSDGTNWVNLG